MRRWGVLLLTLSFLCLFTGGAFVGFERIALDPAVYDRIQARLDIYDYVGIEPEAQSRVNRVLAGYLRGDIPSLDIEETLWGVYGQVFNADEKAHMVDVLNLFHLERAIRTSSLAAGCLLLAASVVLLMCGLPRACLRALKYVFFTLLACLTLMAALYAVCGFDRLFLLFHRLLFTNDLWLMDPRTDVMIRMLPAGFFMQIAAEAGASALISGTALTALACALPSALAFAINKSRRKHES